MLPSQKIDFKTEEKADKHGGKYNAWEEKGEQSRARAESKMKKEAGITCEVVLEKMEEVIPTEGPFRQSEQEDKLDEALLNLSHQMVKDPYQDEEGKEYYSPSSHRSSSKYEIEIEQLDLDRNKTEFP